MLADMRAPGWINQEVVETTGVFVLSVPSAATLVIAKYHVPLGRLSITYCDRPGLVNVMT
jgi:hypothetical protein